MLITFDARLFIIKIFREFMKYKGALKVLTDSEFPIHFFFLGYNIIHIIK